MLEILDGGALAQELGIGHHRAIRVRPRFPDDALDLVASSHRHGRLGDDHGKAVEGARDLAGRFVDKAEVGEPIAAA